VLEQAAHRPQLAVDRAGGIHLVYYARQGNTQAIAYRYRKAHGTWTPLEWLEAKDGNSLGPDLVLDANGMPWITFDHTLEDGTGTVFVAHRTRAGWSQLEQVSTTEKAEVSSAHLALDATGALTVVWLERPLEPGHFMQIHSRTRSRSGRWGTTERVEAHRFDAWHPNIVANPRGLQLMGFDLSLGPDRHQVQVREKRDGSWLESLVLGDSQTGGQRPNLAIDGKGVAHVVWTAIQGPFRLGVYYSRGYSNQGHWRWTKPKRITAGISGFHYDPDVAIDPSGQARALWSWYDRGKTGVLSMMLEAGSAVPALIPSEGKAGYSCLAAGPDGHFYAAWNDGGSGRLYFVESTGS